MPFRLVLRRIAGEKTADTPIVVAVPEELQAAVGITPILLRTDEAERRRIRARARNRQPERIEENRVRCGLAASASPSLSTR